jgi:chloramphenicol-sensitive protein RarD
LAHRIIWSFVLMLIVVTAVRRLGDLKAISGSTALVRRSASA